MFGCLCYAKPPTKIIDKFDERGVKCIFVGCSLGTNRWKTFDLQTKRFFVSRDVVFYEDSFPYISKHDEIQMKRECAGTNFLEANGLIQT